MGKKVGPPRMLCWKCKCQWEQEKLGEEYTITDRDMGEAKKLLEASGRMPDNDSIVAHVRNFCRDEWTGWKSMNHPLWALFRNWNKYNPKPMKQERVGVLIRCTDCQTVHNPNDLCPKCYPEVTGDRQSAMRAIKGLTEHFKQGG